MARGDHVNFLTQRNGRSAHRHTTPPSGYIFSFTKLMTSVRGTLNRCRELGPSPVLGRTSDHWMGTRDTTVNTTRQSATPIRLLMTKPNGHSPVYHQHEGCRPELRTGLRRKLQELRFLYSPENQHVYPQPGRSGLTIEVGCVDVKTNDVPGRTKLDDNPKARVTTKAEQS